MLALVVLWYVAYSDWGIELDEQIIAWIATHSSSGIIQLMGWVTLLGSDEFIVSFSLLMGVFFIIKKNLVHLYLLLLMVLGGILVNFLLKVSFQRLRPGDMYNMDIFGIDTGILSYSFPSGHTMRGGLMVLFILYLLWPKLETRLLKWLISTLAVVILFAVALSRVVLGAHFPTDTMAAIVASIAWSILSVEVVSRIQPSQEFSAITNKRRLT